MIRLEKVTKRFPGVAAVVDLDLHVERGEVMGFLGPNGAGKTTTMRILTSYFPPTTGRAEVCGFDTVRQSIEVRRRIGYMPETVPLYPDMRVSEYLRFRAKIKGVAAKDRCKRFEEVVDRCGLQDVRNRIVGQISKGYRQRVGLAEALIHDPELLILDEPTIGLDPNQIRQVRDLIRSLGQEHTVLLSTHILPEAEATCSRVAILHRGRLLAVDTLDRLRMGLPGGRWVVAELDAEESAARKVLEALPGAAEVRTAPLTGGWVRAEVTARGDEDLRPDVAKAAADARMRLRELRFHRGTLEEVFAQVTAS